MYFWKQFIFWVLRTKSKDHAIFHNFFFNFLQIFCHALCRKYPVIGKGTDKYLQGVERDIYFIYQTKLLTYVRDIAEQGSSHVVFYSSFEFLGTRRFLFKHLNTKSTLDLFALFNINKIYCCSNSAAFYLYRKTVHFMHKV